MFSLIKNVQRYLDLLKINSEIIQSLRKNKEYHKSLIQYLVDIYNEHLKQMIELKKEAEMNTNLLYKDYLKFPRKVKSNMYGHFNFKKRVKSKILTNNINSHNSENNSKRELFDLNKSKINIKKQKSTQIGTKFLQNALKETMKQDRAKQNTKSSNKTKQNISANKRTKSLDDWKIIGGDMKDKLNERKSITKKGKRSIPVINDK